MLQSPVSINQYVQVIGLPDPSNTLGEGIECRACGWGYTDYVGCKY